MRITLALALALFLAGCLRAQAPARPPSVDPSALRTFERLLYDADTIGEAEAYARARGLVAADTRPVADRAYRAYLGAKVYPQAAEIASRFRFGPRAIAQALRGQRAEADRATDAYLRRKREKDGPALLHAAAWELALEMRISCRYGPTAQAADTVKRAMTLEALSGEDDVLYPLLDEGCPVDSAMRTSIIDRALLEDKDAYAIRHGAASDWDPVRTSQFLWGFFLGRDCTDGITALAAFKVPVEDATPLVQEANCEDEIIDSRAWPLAKEAADAYFFAAVRGKKFNLALELHPFGALGDDGRAFLYQEALRSGGESALMKALEKHPGYHDPFMAYAWDRGRYRFIGNFSRTLDWQRRAFDKLIELGQYDFAAEVAQYGASEALRTEGVLIAFRASMAAGDFKMGRYFVARYGPRKDVPGLVTDEMYEAEREKWYAARKLSDPQRASKDVGKKRFKPKRKRGRCPTDDWCP
jgi:hypothetical protein